ncbi:MAG: phosphotransferase [Pseudomonadota bacterium]|nr:phosphotransferase [Pseudomonadota bacterium]
MNPEFPSARVSGFLARCGLSSFVPEPMAEDCSTRRYTRIRAEDRTYVLMETDNPQEDIGQFAAIAGVLRAAGLRVPQIFRAEVQEGLALVEDFGNDTFGKAMAAGTDPETLYLLATDALVRLHRNFRPDMLASIPHPVYDAGNFIRQVMLFPEVVPAALGYSLSPAQTTGFEVAWRQVLPRAFRVPQSLMLRDFHAENLMLVPGTSGPDSCGFLDFELTGQGPVTYDLVSLLEDARRDVPPALALRMKDHWLHAFPHVDPVTFAESYSILGAIRHTRIIAVFMRQSVTLGRDRYLPYLPRVWGQLENQLQKEVLAPVRAWFDANIPTAWRREIPARKDRALA